jgi:NitT/TauT family transport system substrate-binding protein
MEERHSRRSAISRLAMLPIAVAALGKPQAARAALGRLHLGILNFDPSTPAVYAQAAGLFAAAGLDVTIEVIGSGSAVAAAVIGGSVDIGLSSLFALLSAHEHAVPLTLVAGGAIYDSAFPPVSGLLVKANSPYQRPSDFNGKIVSVAALNDEMLVNIRSWVDRSGGRSETIQFVELTGSGIGTALDTNRIDAAGVGNPVQASLLATGKYRTIGDPSQGIASHYLTAAWIATPDYAQKNGAIVKAFANALGKAAAFSNTHSQVTAPMLAKYTGADPETIARMPRSHYNANLSPSEIQPVIDASAKYKVIPSSFPAREIIYG